MYPVSSPQPFNVVTLVVLPAGQTIAMGKHPFGPRPWVVNLSDLNGKTWVRFVAAGPALLAFVLVFLDDGLTWHLINHPSHKLNHGDAYNVSNFSSYFCGMYTYRFFVPLYIAHLCKSNYS